MGVVGEIHKHQATKFGFAWCRSCCADYKRWPYIPISIVLTAKLVVQYARCFPGMSTRKTYAFILCKCLLVCGVLIRMTNWFIIEQIKGVALFISWSFDMDLHTCADITISLSPGWPSLCGHGSIFIAGSWMHWLVLSLLCVSVVELVTYVPSNICRQCDLLESTNHRGTAYGKTTECS